MYSSRDQLILGLLAIQNGLINREQLVSAFSSWLGNSNKPLTDYLLEAQSLTREDVVLLERLAQRIESKEAWIEQTTALIPEAKFVAKDLEGLAFPDAELTQSLVTILQSPPITSRSEAITGAALPESDEVGKKIGPYKLLQPIGSGGMGTVWMAEQEQPVRRRVAIKLIKAGLDNRQIVARFEAERQALSMMDHPSIARVLDMGSTAAGQPYFVMELVHGIPFTEYCDKNRLSLRERLELFVPVCHAIQHAHQKGIIHRDLKPSNILVAQYDGKPVPKVIDFGLAKATEIQNRLTDKTMFTEFGQVVGTIQYMSPEQAEMNSIDVDTRTDVYSLGVMLYELLTGSTPIDRETMRREAILKVLQSIREVEPPRPSARLSSASKEAVGSISEQRRIDPRKLQSLLRGELDWIVMKALEKNRNRRYSSANDLATDVENHLSGDPVSARPPSITYQLQKIARKHRALVASTLTILGLLVAAVILVSRFAYDAEQAREVAVSKQSEAELASDEKSKAIDELREEQAKKAAEIEKSEKALARSKYLLSVARWNEGKRYEAIATLDEIPEKHRHIEWYIDRSMYFPKTRTFVGHHGAIDKMALSHDNTLLASRATDGIRVWSMRTGAHLAHLPVKSQANSIRFTPDNKSLIYDHEGLLHIWDIESRQVRHTLQVQDGVIFDFCPVEDGTVCVLASRTSDNSEASDLTLVHIGQGSQVLSTFYIGAFIKAAKLQVYERDAVIVFENSSGENEIAKFNIHSRDRMRITPFDSKGENCFYGSLAQDIGTAWIRGLDTSGSSNETRLIFFNATTGEMRQQPTFPNLLNVEGTQISPDGLHLVTRERNGATIDVIALPSGQLCARMPFDIESPQNLCQFTSDGTRLLNANGKIIYAVNLFPTIVSKDWLQEGVRVTETSYHFFARCKDKPDRVNRSIKRYHHKEHFFLVENKKMLFIDQGNLAIFDFDSQPETLIKGVPYKWIGGIFGSTDNSLFDVVSGGITKRFQWKSETIRETDSLLEKADGYFFPDFYDQRHGVGFAIRPETGSGVMKVYDQNENPPLTIIPTSEFIMDWNGRKLGLGTSLNRKQFIIGDAETGEVIRGYPWETESKSSSSVQDRAIELDGEYYGIDSNPDIISYRVRSAVASEVPGYVIAMSMDQTNLILIDATDGERIRSLPIPTGLSSLQQVQYFEVSADQLIVMLRDELRTYMFESHSNTWHVHDGLEIPSLIQKQFKNRFPSTDCRVTVVAQDTLLLVRPQSQNGVENWTDLSQSDPAWIDDILNVDNHDFSLAGRIAKEKNDFARYYRFQRHAATSFPYNEQGSLDYRKRLSQWIEQKEWSSLNAEFERFIEHTLKTYIENPSHAGIVFGEQARSFARFKEYATELNEKTARLVELALAHCLQLPTTERDQLVAIRACVNGIHDWETERAVWNDYLQVRERAFSIVSGGRFGNTLPRHWQVLAEFYKSQLEVMNGQTNQWMPAIKLATLICDAGKSDDLKVLTPSLEAIAFPLELDSNSVESLRSKMLTAETLLSLRKIEMSLGILTEISGSTYFSQFANTEKFDFYCLALSASLKAELPPNVIDELLEKALTQFELLSGDMKASRKLIAVATLLISYHETIRAKRLLGIVTSYCVVQFGGYERDIVLVNAWIEMVRLMRVESDLTHSIILARLIRFFLENPRDALFYFSSNQRTELKNRLDEVCTNLQTDDRLPLTSKTLIHFKTDWNISYDEFEEMERYVESGESLKSQSESFKIIKQAFSLWRASPSLSLVADRPEYPSYFLDTRSCLHESLGLNSWLVEEKSNLWVKDEGGTRKPFQRQLPAEWPENTNGLFLSHARASEETVGWDKPRYDFSAEDRAFLLQGIPTLPSIFAHAPSKHMYQLDQKWHRFTGKVGIDRSLSNSSCVFEVLGDGKSLWKSARVSGWDAEEFDIDVSTVSTLELVVNDAGDGNNNDWACWFQPLLTRNQAVGMRIVYPPAAADRLNWAVWAVVQPTPNGRYSRSRYEQELTAIRKLVAQYPNGGAYNTLGVAEFRCGNYQAAIDACQKSIELQPKESGLEVPFPVDFAVVAMCYLYLGQLEKVEEYRIKMEQAMKSVTFLNNAECESFQAELKAALEAHRQTR